MYRLTCIVTLNVRAFQSQPPYFNVSTLLKSLDTSTILQRIHTPEVLRHPPYFNVSTLLKSLDTSTILQRLHTPEVFRHIHHTSTSPHF
ncbi:hypothetical protein Bpfe_022753 [Biomphalaria pfeifferi]|uniref:Uncharacterized protein n=1 Tax=Biomphalaria pfeifferi TaxID=112525 RepID=A0AAD8B5K4_BIOPF|nr:hypothetical protein Bpfe_022753 [Biomphalaria pfeifferi]